MRQWCWTILFLCAYSLPCLAQEQFSGQFNTIINYRFSQKTGGAFDMQLRSSENFNHFQSILLRPSVNYALSKSFTIAFGYQFSLNKRRMDNVAGLLPEHALWQQLLHTYRWEKGTTSNRLRLEERFLPVPEMVNNKLQTHHYNTAYRVRYSIRNMLPIGQKGPAFINGWYVALQDEIFINPAKQWSVTGKTFDRNRLTGALGYRFPHNIDIEAGYINQYAQTRTDYTHNHIAQLAVLKRM